MIPFRCVKKIGPDIILVEIHEDLEAPEGKLFGRV